MNKSIIIIAIVLLINCIVIFSSVKSGIDKGDMMLRFHERQAITFLSALMLGLTSLVNLIMYLLKKKIFPLAKSNWFWLLASVGFLYLCMDEYFMAHEGMDEIVGALFAKDIKYLNLDNLVIAFFGLVALGICLYFRKEILRHRRILPFLAFGSLGLIGTVVLHSFEGVNIIFEVMEESFKIIGVSFFFSGFLTVMVSFIRTLSITIGEEA